MRLIPQFLRRRQADAHESRSIQQLASQSIYSSGLHMLSQYGSEDTGITVTPETAIQAASVWSCVSRIARDLSSCPVHVIDRQTGGRVQNHPIAMLLEQPNDVQTAPAFWMQFLVNLLLYGWGGAAIEPGGGRYPAGLLPLMTRDIQPGRQQGQAFYRHSPSGTTLRPDQLVAVAYMSRDGLTGTSPIAAGSRAVGTDIALSSFAARFFKQGAALRLWADLPVFKDQDAHQQAIGQIKDAIQGMESAHGVGGYPGVKLTQIGSSPRDAQAVEARQFQLGEVARLFNMPIGLLDASESKYNGLLAQYEDYAKATLRPWAVLVLAEMTRKLFPPSELPRFKLAWNFDAILEADIVSRAEAVTKLVAGGIITPNEGRQRFRYQSVEGGDSLLSPLNMLPAEQRSIAPAETRGCPPQLPAPDPEPADDDRVLSLVASIASSLATKESNAARRAAKSGPAEFRSWCSQFWPDHAAHIAERLPILSPERAKQAAAEARDAMSAAAEAGTLEELLEGWQGQRLEQLKKSCTLPD
jgi:HK97 family phage portal protein